MKRANLIKNNYDYHNDKFETGEAKLFSSGSLSDINRWSPDSVVIGKQIYNMTMYKCTAMHVHIHFFIYTDMYM